MVLLLDLIDELSVERVCVLLFVLRVVDAVVLRVADAVVLRVAVAQLFESPKERLTVVLPERDTLVP